MFIWLLLLFICVPFVELALLLLIGDRIGAWPTLGIVVVTGVVGSWLARSQGLRTYYRIQQELAAGRMPQTSLADGAMILFAGALLLTPGVLTDAFGLSLLIPYCRTFYRYWLTRWLKSKVQVYGGTMSQPEQPSDIVDSHVVPRELPEHNGIMKKKPPTSEDD